MIRAFSILIILLGLGSLPLRGQYYPGPSGPEPPPKPRPLPPVSEQLRTWTDLQGNAIEAGFFGIDETTVWLQSRDGKIVPVPLDQLSAEDQDFLKYKPKRPPVNPPQLRVEVTPKRDTNIKRQITQRSPFLAPDIPQSYQESRSMDSYLNLDILLSAGQEVRVEATYYCASKGANGWSIAFVERYRASVKPPDRKEISTRQLQIKTRETRDGAVQNVGPVGYNTAPEEQEEAVIYPQDWVLAIIWRDLDGRPYLLHSEASDPAILRSEEIQGQIARGFGKPAEPERRRPGWPGSSMRRGFP